MLKKLVPLLLAGAVFVVAVVMMRPEPESAIAAAAKNLPAGHILLEADIEMLSLPADLQPEGAYIDPTLLIGETLKIDRSKGDILLPAHLGGEALVLEQNERAIAIEVTDAAGLAGLLRPGDRVGVTAVLLSTQGTFAKVVAEDLRVLYLSPDFEALDPAVMQPPEEGQSSLAAQAVQREKTGVVVLAVPIAAQAVSYDFSSLNVDSETRQVNVIDLLPALDHARDVELSLFIQPENAHQFTSSGVYLPDLVITPGPTPTPTPGP